MARGRSNRKGKDEEPKPSEDQVADVSAEQASADSESASEESSDDQAAEEGDDAGKDAPLGGSDEATNDGTNEGLSEDKSGSDEDSVSTPTAETDPAPADVAARITRAGDPSPAPTLPADADPDVAILVEGNGRFGLNGATRITGRSITVTMDDTEANREAANTLLRAPIVTITTRDGHVLSAPLASRTQGEAGDKWRIVFNGILSVEAPGA